METDDTTRICKCCGKKLPIQYFKLKDKLGREVVCESCKETVRKGSLLTNYTIQELLRELRSRGVKGKFTFTETKVIEI